MFKGLYRAVSIDQIHWYVQVWSNYVDCYVDIKGCPSFKSGDSAIVWAMSYWEV